MQAPFLRCLRSPESRRHIFHLAWPTVTEMALQTVVQYVDTAQVGRLGANASAAVGLTGTTTWLVNAPIWALSMGVLSCISQALGSGDEERARRAANQSVLITLYLGVGMTILTLAISPFLPVWLGADPEIRRDAGLYFGIICIPMLFRVSSIIFASVLRAAGNTKTPMQINVLMNLINILLNFLFINPSQVWKIGALRVPMWGAGLGVAGAAIATAAAYAAGGTLMFLSALRRPELHGLRPVLDVPVMSQCLRISAPIAVERVVTMLGQVVFTALIARLGTVAVAAHSIAITAEQIFYVPGYGMQAAAATLAGFHIGARDEKRLMEYSSAIIAIAVVLMTFLSLFLFLFPGFFMSLFTPDREVITLGAKVLRIVSLSEPFYAVLIILEGTFNGAGDTRAPLFFSLFSMWGVRITCTWICVDLLQLDLTAVWWCMVADNMVRFALLLHRYRGQAWKRSMREPSQP